MTDFHEAMVAKMRARIEKIRDDIEGLPTSQKLHLAAEMMEAGLNDMALSVAEKACLELRSKVKT